jgi:glutamine synthetase
MAMTTGRDERYDLQDEHSLREEVTARIEREGIRQVRIATCDLHGIPRAKMLSADHFLQVMTKGHPWALALLAVDIWQDLPKGSGFRDRIGFGNGVMRPDLRTFRRLPWTEGVAHVIADVFTREGETLPTARQVLGGVLDRAARMGHHPVFGNELEFYAYRPEADDGFGHLIGMQAWFTDQALGMAQPFLDDLHRHLTEMKVEVYEIFNEHGGGQFEINLRPGVGLGAVDQVVLMKMAIKEIAVRHGLRATFMGKPTDHPEIPVSGYHMHQSLRDASGRNLFHEPADPIGLSELGRHYIGGLLEHGMALTGLGAPTVTAYKRYVPGTWAPTRVSWGVDNRTAMIRLVPSGPDANLESRLASSDANPYVLAASMAAAGLDGVARRLDPGPPSNHDVLEDEKFRHVPRTLIEGAEAVAADRALVDLLGEDFCGIYVALLRHEWTRFIGHVTDWEIREYRELL